MPRPHRAQVRHALDWRALREHRAEGAQQRVEQPARTQIVSGLPAAGVRAELGNARGAGGTLLRGSSTHFSS